MRHLAFWIPVFSTLLVVLSNGCEGARGCDEVAQAARAVLETNCYRCHGQDDPPMGGVNVLDVAGMLEKKAVLPGQPDESPLYQRLSQGAMPPAGEAPRPSAQDIEKLKQWIACGAKDFVQSRGPGSQILMQTMLRAMRSDLEEHVSESRRPHTRYLVLTHLWNAGVDDATLDLYRRALSKMLNSLSWGSKVVAPVAIDPQKTVYRIYLPDYRWQPQAGKSPDGDLWNLLLGAYPFGLIQESSDDYAFVRDETGTPLPWIHADWFVNATSVPPLYYTMLRLPSDLPALEAELGVNSDADIAQGVAMRAGFSQSGVSQHNRVIERHDSSFGPYWKSYDFQDSDGVHNIFAKPLGPPSPFSIDPAFEFQQSGGEILFSLPNGLQGFVIVGSDGSRLDEAPAAIVTDKQQPDGIVRSGRSCMGCHLDGIIFKADEIRTEFDPTAAIASLEVVNAVHGLYPPAAEFEQVQTADRELYRSALSATNASHGGAEPVSALADDFDRALDLERAAAELWVTVDALRNNAAVLKLLAPLDGSPGRSVKRDVFQSVFQNAICILQEATPLVNGVLGCASSAPPQ